MPQTSSRLPAHVVREISVASDTDPRTVVKYIGGESVKPLAAKRIDRALRTRGLKRLDGSIEPRGIDK